MDGDTARRSASGRLASGGVRRRLRRRSQDPSRFERRRHRTARLPRSPLIVYGHHEDLAGGLDALADTAGIINRLGEVRWMSIGEIVASSKRVVRRRWSRHRSALRAEDPPLASARRVGADRASPGGLTSNPGALTGFSLRAGPFPGRRVPALPFGSEIPLDPAPGSTVEIALQGGSDVELDGVPEPAWRPWPKLRRLVTESARPRGRPHVRRRRRRPPQWPAAVPDRTRAPSAASQGRGAGMRGPPWVAWRNTHKSRGSGNTAPCPLARTSPDRRRLWQPLLLLGSGPASRSAARSSSGGPPRTAFTRATATLRPRPRGRPSRSVTG